MPVTIHAPERSRVDEVWEINVSNLPGHTETIISAKMTGLFGHTWQSRVTFFSDDHGNVNINTQAPLSGSYAGVDPMGLIWSMECEGVHGLLARRFDLSDATVIITVENKEGFVLAQKSVTRYLINSDIIVMPIRVDGLVGTMYHPPFHEEKQPALIVLSGSEGGCRHEQAALLASEGYTTFALAYFIHDQSAYSDLPENFPKTIHEIPLEYFEKAIHFLQQQPHVDKDKIGVVGTSRGGELALLLASIYQEIKCVVSYVPNHAVQAAFGPSDHLVDETMPSWTLNNKPVPCLPLKVSKVAWFDNNPVVLKEGFLLTESDDKEPYSFATTQQITFPASQEVLTPWIAVEKINGPILLISAGNDEMWPSKAMANLILKRLQKKQHPFENASKHLCYEDAGHLIMTPYWPTTGLHAIHPVDLVDYDFGGTAKADSGAGASSWTEIRTFLDKTFRHELIHANKPN